MVYETAEKAWYNHAFLYNGQIMTDIGTLALGAVNSSTGISINIKGQIAGSSVGSSPGAESAQHAFLYTPGEKLIDLGALLKSSATSTATGINATGEVVGYSFDGSTYNSWWYNGAMHQLTGADKIGMNQAVSINDNGVILLHIWPNAGGSACYLSSNSVLTRLPVSGTCVPAALTNGGTVTGDVYDANYAHAFLYRPGASKLIDLGTLAPGAATAQSHGYGVSESGTVVGTSLAPDGSNHAFLNTNGEMIDLNKVLLSGSVWATLVSATGINAAGQITGAGWIHTKSGEGACVPGGDCAMHAFRLDPR